jgi:methylmalonyl-CoA/ethylmalonyl-CoA epimerase
MRFHHIGVVTGSLEQSVALYVSWGYTPSETFDDPIQKARIVLLNRADTPTTELISPLREDSPSFVWLHRTQGCGPYHVCYEVPDLEKAAAQLRAYRIYPVMKPVPAVAFQMRRVTFLWGRQSGLIELLEAASVGKQSQA